MYLYNSATHKKEEFRTHTPGHVEMYTCGPTVYHFAHIGNLRSYIMEDVLEKYLRYAGYSVNRVMNITDVGHLTSDFAASLRIPATVPEAARAVVEGTPRPLDLGTHNDRYFSYVASFGAFTKASYSAPQETKNALGHFAYILEGIKNLDSLRPYRCAVEADGEMFDGDFIFGAVCNSTSLGGLVKLDPKRVHMDDGMFELMLLRMPKTALDLQNLITALNRMDYDYPGVIFRHVRSVTVTTREDIPWSLDGEYAPSAPRVEIRNLHSAVRLMIKEDE